MYENDALVGKRPEIGANVAKVIVNGRKFSTNTKMIQVRLVTFSNLVGKRNNRKFQFEVNLLQIPESIEQISRS